MRHGAKIELTPIERITTEDNNGHQKIMSSDKTIPLHFDGRKMCLNIRAPTEHKLTNLEAIEMTSPLPFEPDTQEILIIRKHYTKKYMRYPGGF